MTRPAATNFQMPLATPADGTRKGAPTVQIRTHQGNDFQFHLGNATDALQTPSAPSTPAPAMPMRAPVVTALTPASRPTPPPCVQIRTPAVATAPLAAQLMSPMKQRIAAVRAHPSPEPAPTHHALAKGHHAANARRRAA